MKGKIIIFFIFFIFFQPLKADIKKKIISNLEKTDNLTFNFKQKIEQKNEDGICTIEYPKKIYCIYNNLNEKILVSDGNSLVIKNKNINQYYLYSLKKTPLEFILDKKFLINKIKNLDGRLINNKYYNFTLINNNYIINIFFDNTNYNLTGWQTEDVYKNLVITYISNIKINQKIDKNIFNLPKNY